MMGGQKLTSQALCVEKGGRPSGEVRSHRQVDYSVGEGSVGKCFPSMLKDLNSDLQGPLKAECDNTNL